jgi:hypothetical protein
MRSFKLITLAAFVLTALGVARAADLAGTWTAEFDSQIGTQKYTYEFKVDGDKITGKATFDHSMGKGETVLKDIKLSGDTLSFVEPMKINDAEVTISYTGKIAGDEIKLTRNVGDFGTEQLVAKRQKAHAAKAADGK